VYALAPNKPVLGAKVAVFDISNGISDGQNLAVEGADGSADGLAVYVA